MKIEKSKEQNEKRIQKMKKVNDYIVQLEELTRQKVKEDLASDQAAYKTLLKDLLLQGLIKLMESTIVIRCREQDVGLIEEVMEQAVSEYKQMVVDQVKIFEGKSPDDIPCKISIDTTKYLPSADDDEKSGCIGGFKIWSNAAKSSSPKQSTSALPCVSRRPSPRSGTCSSHQCGRRSQRR